MKAKLEIEGLKLEVDFSKGQDISIPLIFNGSQPNTYNVNNHSHHERNIAHCIQFGCAKEARNSTTPQFMLLFHHIIYAGRLVLILNQLAVITG